MKKMVSLVSFLMLLLVGYTANNAFTPTYASESPSMSASASMPASTLTSASASASTPAPAYMSLSASASALPSAEKIRVTVDGVMVAFPDAAPFIDGNGRTLVPLRPIAEAMGMDVKWSDASRVARFISPVNIITFKIGNNYFNYNNHFSFMDTQAVIVDGRTYAPVRYLAEAAGYKVDWDADKFIISISKNYNISEPLADSDIELMMDKYIRIFAQYDLGEIAENDLGEIAENDFLRNMMEYAVSLSLPAFYSLETDVGPGYDVDVAHIRWSDVLDTAGLLYTDEILAKLRPVDVVFYDYDSNAGEFIEWGYFDPPECSVPVVLNYASKDGVCEVILTDALQSGFMGFFFSAKEHPWVEDELYWQVMYYDALSEEAYYESKQTDDYYADDGTLMHPVTYTEYLSDYEPAYQRAVDYMRKNPEMFNKYKATLVTDGQSVKLAGIEYIE